MASTAGAVWLIAGRQGDATLTTYAAASGAAALGALVPDIDHPRSLIGKGLPAGLLTAGIGALLLVTIGDYTIAQQGDKTIGAAMMLPLIDAVRPFLLWAWFVVGIAISLLLISLAASTVLEHRGPTHSLTAAVAVALVACAMCAVFGWAWTLGLVVGWGYLSHLLTDLMTPMGLPAVMWPWREVNLARLAPLAATRPETIDDSGLDRTAEDGELG